MQWAKGNAIVDSFARWIEQRVQPWVQEYQQRQTGQQQKPARKTRWPQRAFGQDVPASTVNATAPVMLKYIVTCRVINPCAAADPST